MLRLSSGSNLSCQEAIYKGMVIVASALKPWFKQACITQRLSWSISTHVLRKRSCHNHKPYSTHCSCVQTILAANPHKQIINSMLLLLVLTVFDTYGRNISIQINFSFFFWATAILLVKQMVLQHLYSRLISRA